jgi:outer membrane protein assembly factor BamB
MMKTKNLRRLLGLITVGLLAAYGVDQLLDAGRYKRWMFDAGESVDCASRLCNDGTLITGNYHRILALHGTTGTKKWSFTGPDGSENLASAPVVGPDDTVYVPTQKSGKPYRVFALDGATGRLKWVIEQQAVVLAPGEHRTLFLGYKQLTAVDGATGKPLWTFKPPLRPDVDSDLRSYDGRVEAMASARRTVYAVYGCPYNTLVALDADTGQRKWGAPFNRSGQFSCSVPASLVVTEDGIPIVSVSGASLFAYEAQTGHALWRVDHLGGLWSAQLQNGPGHRLYAGSDQGTVWALDARTGARLWERELGAKISHPPVVAPDGVLYVGTNANKVYALNARTGQIQWSVSFGWLTRNFIPGYGEDISLTVSPNGTVYAASSDGRIYALHSP